MAREGGSLSVTLYRWVINAAALFIVTRFSRHVSGDTTAIIIAAVVLGLVNAWIRPFVVMLTLPINVVTLGLFTLVVNGLMLWLTSVFVPGLIVEGFWSSVWAALWLSIVSSLLSMVVRPW